MVTTRHRDQPVATRLQYDNGGKITNQCQCAREVCLVWTLVCILGHLLHSLAVFCSCCGCQGWYYSCCSQHLLHITCQTQRIPAKLEKGLLLVYVLPHPLHRVASVTIVSFCWYFWHLIFSPYPPPPAFLSLHHTHMHTHSLYFLPSISPSPCLQSRSMVV